MRCWTALGILALGCGPLLVPACSPRAEMAAGTITTGSSSTSSPAKTSTSTDITTTAADFSTTTTSSGSSSGDDAAFITDPDSGPPVPMCDIFAQDCPRGEKCTIWAADGGEWDASKCVPLAPDPQDVGAPCTVEGSATSGIDDCELGAVCLGLDEDTGLGECIAFCTGPRGNPTCDDACSQCTFGASGILYFCLPICDPNLQDCDDDEACHPTNQAFACVPSAKTALGIGEPCRYPNECEPGLVCTNAVPGCVGAGCCTPFCDVEAADVCDALLPGTVCIPFYAEGRQPDTCLTSTVGFCGAQR